MSARRSNNPQFPKPTGPGYGPVPPEQRGPSPMPGYPKPLPAPPSGTFNDGATRLGPGLTPK